MLLLQVVKGKGKSYSWYERYDRRWSCL